MGVVTTADRFRDKAKENLNDAYNNILVVLDEKTWGHDDFSNKYIDQLQEVALKILKLKRKL